MYSLFMNDSLLSKHFTPDPANTEKTVVVGMSGGVDSSVSALILKYLGYKVVGLFMKNWEENDEHGVCQASKEYADVVSVCERLEIPYYSVEFVEEYRKSVFDFFLKEYAEGHTPNPDILCNREIKFKVFFDYARKLGADFLATGHYCQNKLIAGRHRLVKGVDANKDQTYFLYTMKEEVLKHVLFPIGGLEKSVVRELARVAGLTTQDKKDSTGICFIGERNFKPFLARYLAPQKGSFVSLDGEVVGQHEGAQFYTLGQRKGLGLGGQGEPWFVVSKNMKLNQVVVVRGERHPALFCDELWSNELSFVNSDWEGFIVDGPVGVKNRYRQADQVASAALLTDQRLHLHFALPQRSITPRQSVVLYKEIEGEMVCLGGGMILSAGESYHERSLELPEIVGS